MAGARAGLYARASSAIVAAGQVRVALALLVVSLLAAWAPGAAQAYTDPFEPNQNIAEAKAMPLGPYIGPTFDAAIDPATDVDVYRIHTTAADVTVQVG